jgi:4-amino-4-deoxy-L-arabinose transferase-like glycosyltransferase
MTVPATVGAPPSRRTPLKIALAFVALALVLHLPGFVVHLFNSDEASIATMGMVIERGGEFYRDTADRKPPAVPYIYAAVFELTGNHDLRPVRAAAALALAATAILLAAEARRRYRSPTAAVGCGVLFLLGCVSFFPADAQGAGFEVFMLLPMTASFVAAARNRSIQAGLWLGLACLTKQTAILTLVPVAYLLYRSGGWRAVGRAALAGGGLVAVTALAFGPSDFLLWTLAGNGGYMALRGSMEATFVRAFSMTLIFLVGNAALVWLGVRAHRRSGVALELWLWLAGGAVAVLLGLRFFGHYYLQLTPPLALIAAAALPELTARVRRWTWVVAAVPATLMLAFAFFPPEDFGVLPYGRVATRVQALAGPDEPVFVWGSFPEIYWAADRQPATRFIHTGFLVGDPSGRPPGTTSPRDGIPGAWLMLVRDLEARPPAVVIDTSEARIRGVQYHPLDETGVWASIRSNYELVEVVDGVRLYRRVGPA